MLSRSLTQLTSGFDPSIIVPTRMTLEASSRKSSDLVIARRPPRTVATDSPERGITPVNFGGGGQFGGPFRLKAISEQLNSKSSHSHMTYTLSISYTNISTAGQVAFHSKSKSQLETGQIPLPFGHQSTTYLLNQPFLTRTFTTTKGTMAHQYTARQNYSEEAEAHINKQINLELYASYVYMSMAYYFDREDVALPGFCKYFKKNSDEEREHAEKLMKYQNRRGGRIVLQPIAKPTRDEWSGPLEAITAALELEKTVNQTLLDLHVVSSRNGDAHLTDFLETEYLDEQVKSIKELVDHITNLNRVGKGFGEYAYDKELNESSS